ncbi:hypothetical protein BC936DRAFT_138903 [Jimgerdemannia flammicorona]|uniref:Uncharacterized protein n=1 Tax=Jimgerdemannia flammicorona TaxID=994334 RepID=A0A433BEG1_9FUNG|nr:hypothetical protein BC936DRAFT_138903 [Jimgerdemannia flammicorona]
MFQDLAVDQDVQAGTIKPHQYLILSLDFSAVDRDPDPKIAKAGLFNMINTAIRYFYMTYATYLGDYKDLQLIQTFINLSDAIDSLSMCVMVVQAALRAVPQGDAGHLLAGVKGVTI